MREKQHIDDPADVADQSGRYPADGSAAGTPSGKKGFSLRSIRTFTSLKNPAFRLYLSNMLGYTGAMNMEVMARNYLIWRLTQSPTILGLKSLALAGPMLFFSLFGGVIADRVQKNHVLLVGQLLSGGISLAVALSLALGYLSADHGGSWWILLVAAAFQGTVMSLVMPSRQVLLYEIVGGEEILNAVSLNTLAMNGMRIIGPALAGLFIYALGFTTTYFVITGLYLASSLIIPLLPRSSPTALAGQGALSNIKEGLGYVRRETILLLILVFALVGILLATPYMTLMPIVADNILGVGAAGLGTMMAFIGIGAIAGSLILASLPSKRRGLLLMMSTFVFSVALIGFAFSSSYYLSLVLLIVVGLGQSGLIAVATAILQDYSRDEYRGRVMSIFMMEIGLMGFAGFGAALLTEVIGVQQVIGGFAMALAVMSLLVLALVPRLRGLE
ncbi:MAG: MFS transporter [Dehalococcoidia bacterium]|nr:MFS transporter [Dehalococcoidia bacterium]